MNAFQHAKLYNRKLIGFSSRHLSSNYVLPTFSNDSELASRFLSLVNTPSKREKVDSAAIKPNSQLRSDSLNLSDIENILGRVVQIENKINQLRPKKSVTFLSHHTFIIELLSSLEPLIQKILESDDVTLSNEYSNIISFLSSSLIRSLLILDKVDQATSLLKLVSNSNLVTIEIAQRLLEYFIFMANNSIDRNSSSVFKKVSPLFNCSIGVLLWYHNFTNGSYPSINMITLALKCVEDHSQAGLALLLYKKAIINHPNYKYDPERTAILLQHFSEKKLFSFVTLLLEEIERANPKLSAHDLSESTGSENAVQETLKDWIFAHKPPVSSDMSKWKTLDAFFGDRPLGQIPGLVYRKIIQNLISAGSLRVILKNPNRIKFVNRLVLNLLRRISLWHIEVVGISNNNNQNQFLLDLLNASVLLKSPEIAACSIFRLNPTTLNTRSLSSESFSSLVTKRPGQDYRNLVCFSFWRRAALAAGNFNVALNILPAPESFDEIISAASAINDPSSFEVEQLSSNKKDSFGWFHVLLLILKRTTISSLQSLTRELIKEAKVLNYDKNPIHWQIRLSLASPWSIWELFEEVPALPPSIDSIEVIIPAIFRSALISSNCFEKTISYVEYVISQPLSECPSPLFALTLKSVLLKELIAIENSLHSTSKSNISSSSINKQPGSSLFERMDSNSSATIDENISSFDRFNSISWISKAYSRIAKLKSMVNTWAETVETR